MTKFMAGTVELIGVYGLPVTEELVAAQAELLYGEGASSGQRTRVRQQLESTVLVKRSSLMPTTLSKLPILPKRILGFRVRIGKLPGPKPSACRR